MADYSAMTNEDFDHILAEKVGETPGCVLLTIPGVYEVLSEHFNNEVLEEWATAKELEAEEKSLSGYRVYELCLPRYPEDACPRLDGVVWAILDAAQRETVSRLAEKLSAGFHKIDIFPGDPGIDYDGRDINQMSQLVARLVKEIDEKES